MSSDGKALERVKSAIKMSNGQMPVEIWIKPYERAAYEDALKGRKGNKYVTLTVRDE